MGRLTMRQKYVADIAVLPRRLLLTALGVMFSVAVLSFLWIDAAHTQTTGDYEPNEVVVKLNLKNLGPSPNCESTIADINNDYGTTPKETLLSDPKVACIYLLEIRDGSDVETKAEEIAADPQRRVQYAEPNFIIDTPEGDKFRYNARGDGAPVPSSASTPYRHQYAVNALRLRSAQDINKGGGSVVAVLDTGVQTDHPELANSLVPTDKRYDFADNDSNPEDDPNLLDDDQDGEKDEMTGHGTHVAGIVHLTAPNAKIMPLRVLDSDGTGNIFLIAEAVQYAVDPDNNPGTADGADVINMSFSSSRKSNLIRDVSDDLRADDDDDDDGGDDDDDGGETGPALTGVPVKGAVVVGSAGNNNSSQKQFPAAEGSVIGVASVNKEKRKSGFSNYGKGWVDISAPGTDIYSLFPDNRYAEWSGTSMAAPFVSGQAALIRSQRPGLDSTAPKGEPSVTKIIKINASSLNAGSYRGKLGAGHADAYNSLR